MAVLKWQNLATQDRATQGKSWIAEPRTGAAEHGAAVRAHGGQGRQGGQGRALRSPVPSGLVLARHGEVPAVKSRFGGVMVDVMSRGETCRIWRDKTGNVESDPGAASRCLVRQRTARQTRQTRQTWQDTHTHNTHKSRVVPSRVASAQPGEAWQSSHRTAVPARPGMALRVPIRQGESRHGRHVRHDRQGRPRLRRPRRGEARRSRLVSTPARPGKARTARRTWRHNAGQDRTRRALVCQCEARHCGRGEVRRSMVSPDLVCHGGHGESRFRGAGRDHVRRVVVQARCEARHVKR